MNEMSQDALVGASSLADEPLQQTGADKPVQIRVCFFGLAATITGERNVVLELPAVSKVRDLFAALGHRYGETFMMNLMRKGEQTSCCSVSVDGWLVRSLDTPLAAEGATTVEIMLFSAPEGG